MFIKKLFLWGLFIMVVGLNLTSEAAVKKVAVASFVNGSHTNYGEFSCTNLENEVINGLVQNKNYIVVERGELTKILRELSLQNSGVVDGSTAIEIGKLTGSDYTLLGNVVSADIGQFDNILYSGYKAKVKFALRIVDNKTGVIVVSEVVEGTKSEMAAQGAGVSAENLLSGASTEAAKKVMGKMNDLNPLSGLVLSVKEDMVYFDLGSDDGVRAGDLYTIYKEGKMLIHPVTGEVLGVEEETIGSIKVTAVKPNYAVGQIKSNKLDIKAGYKVKR